MSVPESLLGAFLQIMSRRRQVHRGSFYLFKEFDLGHIFQKFYMELFNTRQNHSCQRTVFHISNFTRLFESVLNGSTTQVPL